MDFRDLNGGEVAPVVIAEFNIVSRSEDLAIFQPDEVRLWDSLSLAGKHHTAPYWLRHRLWPLQELRWS